jgi:ParB family transcriptional regulator, chromosome partitioning protein
MSTSVINLTDIAVPGELADLRQLQSDKVDEIAASMGSSVGLIHSISVRPRKAGGFWLVAGRHRLEAAKKLGWTDILATVHDINAKQAVLIAIDENLRRAELSSIERDLLTARRKEVYEAMHPETRHGATGRGRKKSHGEISFVDDTAKKTGKGRATIARAAARGKALQQIPHAGDAARTSLDKPAEVDALKELPPETAQDLIARAKAGEKVSAKAELEKLSPPQPRRHPDFDEHWLLTLLGVLTSSKH